MKLITDYSLSIENIRLDLKNYIQQNGIRSLVLGVSGGMDSALVAVLVKQVCDEIGIPLIGRSITIETNKVDEINRAKEIGESFCTNFKEVNLTEDYQYLKKRYDDSDDILIENEDEIRKKIRFGNIKARMRMIYLYDLAQKNRGMVLSTDNLSEQKLGFSTLHGDVGDYGIIQNLWKTEVYEMGRFLINNELITLRGKKSLSDCVVATPTDGLGITNSDLDQIGASSYEEVDQILIEFIETGNILNSKVVSRHLRSNFKRNNPYNPPREKFF